MRILLLHPNYHSGGAEIAGNWPPAWVAYLAGSLKRAGFEDIHVLDAMTYHLGPDVLRAKLAELQPDIVGVTAITPAIYEAEAVLKLPPQGVEQALDEGLTPLLRRGIVTADLRASAESAAVLAFYAAPVWQALHPEAENAATPQT